MPKKEKAKLAAAIAYFASPIDLMIEVLRGPIGFLDDIALAAYILNSILNKTDPEIVGKHWVVEKDILDVIKKYYPHQIRCRQRNYGANQKE